MEFIQHLIQHIPEKHYKMIRYSGIYVRHRDIDKKLRRAISREKHHFYRSHNQWRNAILSPFGYDPLKILFFILSAICPAWQKLRKTKSSSDPQSAP